MSSNDWSERIANLLPSETRIAASEVYESPWYSVWASSSAQEPPPCPSGERHYGQNHHTPFLRRACPYLAGITRSAEEARRKGRVPMTCAGTRPSTASFRARATCSES